jgi:hypothetical protein
VRINFWIDCTLKNLNICFICVRLSKYTEIKYRSLQEELKNKKRKIWNFANFDVVKLITTAHTHIRLSQKTCTAMKHDY